jgi:glycosyltransferase involved in cell wall biosynthesis
MAPIHDLMHLYESRFAEVGAHPEWDNRQWLFSNLVRRCSAILTDSAIGKTQVIESYKASADKIHVLPYIAPRSLIEAQAQHPSSLPERLETKSYLFYPAHFWSHKNHVGLLKALAHLSDLPDIHAIFTGAPKNEYQFVTETISHFGLKDRIHLLGYVSDAELKWLYQNARCLIMPTFFGPTNIPPLEAMSLGCPVAVSGIYGMPEQLGDAALYFDPKDPNSIATTIRSLWTDEVLCETLRQRGFALIKAWGPKQFETRVLDIIAAIQTVKTSCSP